MVGWLLYIIVHICAPHYHLFNPRLLRTFSAFRAAWRFGKIQRRPAAAAASAAGAESGVLLWRKPGNHGKTMGKSWENHGKINWKASGRSGDSAQLVGFKSFGIIISAWHRIKNVENEPKLENSKQKQTWAEKHLRTFKHPQDPSVWFSLAPLPPKKNTQRPTSKKHEKTWCVGKSSRLAQRSKFQPSWFPGPLRNHSSQRQEHLALDPAHAGHEPPQGQPQRSRPNTAVPGQRLPLPLNLEKCHKKPLRRPETETLHAQPQRIKKSRCSMVFLWNFERLLWVAAVCYSLPFLRKGEDRWTWLVTIRCLDPETHALHASAVCPTGLWLRKRHHGTTEREWTEHRVLKSVPLNTVLEDALQNCCGEWGRRGGRLLQVRLRDIRVDKNVLETTDAMSLPRASIAKTHWHQLRIHLIFDTNVAPKKTLSISVYAEDEADHPWPQFQKDFFKIVNQDEPRWTKMNHDEPRNHPPNH